MKQQPFKSVLGGGEALPAQHPLLYTQERSKYLQRLAEQTNTQTALPTVDLRNNLRIDHYLSQYNQLKEVQQKRRKVAEARLSSESFQTVFAESEGRRREEKREQRRNRQMQQQLYKNYISDPQWYKPAERDVDEQGEDKRVTVLEIDDNRQKEIYMLDLEIERLKAQQREERKKETGEEQYCRNNELMGRLSSTLLSSYMVYFDEIVGALLDQMLQDEVVYLNAMEAQHHVGYGPQNVSRQTARMMEVVKALDDLCD